MNYTLGQPDAAKPPRKFYYQGRTPEQIAAYQEAHPPARQPRWAIHRDKVRAARAAAATPAQRFTDQPVCIPDKPDLGSDDYWAGFRAAKTGQARNENGTGQYHKGYQDGRAQNP